jgi:hypothetical protein
MQAASRRRWDNPALTKANALNDWWCVPPGRARARAFPAVLAILVAACASHRSAAGVGTTGTTSATGFRERRHFRDGEFSYG